MSDPEHDDAKIVAFRQKPKEAKPSGQPSNSAAAEPPRARGNIAALVLAAVLVLLGWLLVQKLGRNARMEDCLMSGRTNCNPIASPDRE